MPAFTDEQKDALLKPVLEGLINTSKLDIVFERLSDLYDVWSTSHRDKRTPNLLADLMDAYEQWLD